MLHTDKDQGKASVAVQTRDRQADSTLAFMHHEVNTSGKEKRVQLPDGSLIVLADKSEIGYREPFRDKRDITLRGKAYFKVAKDKTRPFTVISGVVSTTALGTEFTVTAFENTSQIIVRLYEGKVVIKPVEKGNLKLRKEVYLLPGQQFVYGGKSVTKMKMAPSTEATPEELLVRELPLDNPSIPQDNEGSWYMFNNQSLDQVFDQLA
jgi:ferric-dicitrate binding protein FerR (iron transport regulator)